MTDGILFGGAVFPPQTRKPDEVDEAYKRDYARKRLIEDARHELLQRQALLKSERAISSRTYNALTAAIAALADEAAHIVQVWD